MGKTKIKNLYLINSSNNLKLFIYSEENEKDPLRYNYYILSLRKNAKPLVFESSNILQVLKDNKIKILKISPEDELYKDIEFSINNAKKINIDIKKEFIINDDELKMNKN